VHAFIWQLTAYPEVQGPFHAPKETVEIAVTAEREDNHLGRATRDHADERHDVAVVKVGHERGLLRELLEGARVVIPDDLDRAHEPRDVPLRLLVEERLGHLVRQKTPCGVSIASGEMG